MKWHFISFLNFWQAFKILFSVPHTYENNFMYLSKSLLVKYINLFFFKIKLLVLKRKLNESRDLFIGIYCCFIKRIYAGFICQSFVLKEALMNLKYKVSFSKFNCWPKQGSSLQTIMHWQLIKIIVVAYNGKCKPASSSKFDDLYIINLKWKWNEIILLFFLLYKPIFWI